jgi:hypothetical protein
MGSGSVAKPQSYFVMFIGIDSAAGIWIRTERSEPPNSSSSTRDLPSSVSRLANTQPAEPAPTTM